MQQKRWHRGRAVEAVLANLRVAEELRGIETLWRQADLIGGPVRLPTDEGREVDVGPLLEPLSRPVRASSARSADRAYGESVTHGPSKKTVSWFENVRNSSAFK
ncbi:hypothetical protein F7R91_19060 [Streptomyces luteolifulvus]|uniref:Uncharacterized protein n=1 Tax=Streptomyces luteolifulvus TaxID=2615112 RepID=A0A6H9UYF1_9ACTN|nr:hypothetical protein [Streptomyces luteolifulvus]KAB1145279.1 hypothetical protein F7R91_19060 [Streptomyces luteolifulvus]